MTDTLYFRDWPEVWLDLLSAARERCVYCGGTGVFPRPRVGDRPCCCVLRRVFTAVWGKLAQFEGRPGAVVMHRTYQFSRPAEEFAADVLRVSRKTLADAHDWRGLRVFEMHFVRGLKWSDCCPRMGIDRPAFFCEVYRVQKRLGRAYAELLPHPLYPTARYFSRQGSEPQELGFARDQARRHTRRMEFAGRRDASRAGQPQAWA